MCANACKRGAIDAPNDTKTGATGRFLSGATAMCAALLLLLTSCTVSPRYRPAPKAPDEPATSASTVRPTPADIDTPEIVEYARSFIGTPYRTGGASRKGMDCSGLVMTVYKEFDVNLPRRSIDQSRVGRTVDRGAVEPGDLVFFKTSSRNPVTHVGIYLGNDQFIHASTSARQVRVDALNDDYFRRRFVVAKRVLEE